MNEDELRLLAAASIRWLDGGIEPAVTPATATGLPRAEGDGRDEEAAGSPAEDDSMNNCGP